MSVNHNVLYSGAAMAELDRWAIEEQGVGGLVLMEAAGTALAREVSRVQPQGRIAVVCGAGNNGGDGYVAARLLRDEGRDVVVLTTCETGRLAGDAKVNAERLPGEAARQFEPAELHGAELIVDALLGTGASGPARGAVADAIHAINEAGVPVVSADIPSGVDAATGAAEGPAVSAVCTVTFAAHKVGLFVFPGKSLAGRVVLAELPYPPRWPVEPSASLLSLEDLLDGFPRRASQSNKFTSGHVVVAGGSRGLSGAVCLSAAAAARAGAGYVTACVPERLVDVVESQLPEVMSAVLPGPGDRHAPESVPVIAELLRRHDGALVVGPGVGTDTGALAFVTELVATSTAPTVLDADGIGAYAANPEALSAVEAPLIITPHAGELARLLGTDTAAVQNRRIEHAERAAHLTGATVVLKGDDTIVATDGHAPAVSPGGAPGLATAGTGDVLAGICGALLSRGMSAPDAAKLAVAIHLTAGRRAALVAGSADGVIASDVIAAIPWALADKAATDA